MEAYRRQLRAQSGASYESQVAPYRSQIVAMCKKQNQDPYLVARSLIKLMKQKRFRENRSLEPHVVAAMYAAALDIEEQKLV